MAETQMECLSLELSNEDVTARDVHIHNPVLTEIAKINGEINKMSIRELQGRLKLNNLDTRGKKDVLKKRLKTFYKKKQLSTANMKDPNGINYHYKYFVIIDFEATCDVGQPSSYRQEIIEFPAVLLDTEKKRIVDEFHSYVRPIVNPKLTTFCMSLTGIRQEMVNKAPYFSDVLKQFEEWLKQHNLSSTSNDFTVVSDGPWDMGRFLMEQCKISNIPLPEWGKKWINVRKTYSNFYDTKRVCLKDMLERLGMRFQGQPHSGIDDSRNIARIVIMLLKDGANLRINERLKERPDTHVLCVANVTKKEFEDSHSKSGPDLNHAYYDPQLGNTANMDQLRTGEQDICDTVTVDKRFFHAELEESHDNKESQRLDSFSEFFRSFQPQAPNINDSEFPLLGSTNTKFSTLRLN